MAVARTTKSTLQQLREDRGLTREVCAKRVGVDVHTWRRWEWSMIRPSAANLFKIARVLGVSVEALSELTTKVPAA